MPLDCYGGYEINKKLSSNQVQTLPIPNNKKLDLFWRSLIQIINNENWTPIEEKPQVLIFHELFPSQSHFKLNFPPKQLKSSSSCQYWFILKFNLSIFVLKVSVPKLFFWSFSLCFLMESFLLFTMMEHLQIISQNIRPTHRGTWWSSVIFLIKLSLEHFLENSCVHDSKLWSWCCVGIKFHRCKGCPRIFPGLTRILFFFDIKAKFTKTVVSKHF